MKKCVLVEGWKYLKERFLKSETIDAVDGSCYMCARVCVSEMKLRSIQYICLVKASCSLNAAK